MDVGWWLKVVCFIKSFKRLTQQKMGAFRTQNHCWNQSVVKIFRGAYKFSI